jgi:sortase A
MTHQGGGEREPDGMGEPSSGEWDFSATAAVPPGLPDSSTTTTTTTTTSQADPEPGRNGGDLLRTSLRGIGQTLITLGFVLLLFVVYEVWVSNLFAQQKQNQARHQLAKSWSAGQDPLRGEDRLNLPSGKAAVIPLGEGFANLYIPRLGKDFGWTIIEGTDDADLNRGPGHYVKTQLPGQIGNFAIAGHRVGKGEPFLNLDQLRPGDAVVIQTAKNWYVYRVLGDVTKYTAAQQIANKQQRDQAVEAALATPDGQGVVGREIVSPSAYQVVDPIPNEPNAKATRALLTMTTCHPKYTANQRMVVHAALERAVPVKGDGTPKELAGGTL